MYILRIWILGKSVSRHFIITYHAEDSLHHASDGIDGSIFFRYFMFRYFLDILIKKFLKKLSWESAPITLFGRFKKIFWCNTVLIGRSLSLSLSSNSIILFFWSAGVFKIFNESCYSWFLFLQNWLFNLKFLIFRNCILWNEMIIK